MGLRRPLGKSKRTASSLDKSNGEEDDIRNGSPTSALIGLFTK